MKTAIKRPYASAASKAIYSSLSGTVDKTHVTVQVKRSVLEVLQVVSTAILRLAGDHGLTGGLHVKGGAVLNLLACRAELSSRPAFRLQDLDLWLNDPVEKSQIAKLIETARTIRSYSPDRLIRVRLDDDSVVDLRVIDCLEFQTVPRKDAVLFKFEVEVDGAWYPVDFGINFTESPMDFDYNAIRLEFSLENPSGHFSASLEAMQSLAGLIEGQPRSFLMWSETAFSTTSTYDRLSLVFHRLFKAKAKGISVDGVDVPDDDCFCSVCQEKPALDGDTDVERQRFEMKSLLLTTRCQHHICCYCYTRMWRQFSDHRSYNRRCPLCRAKLALGPERPTSAPRDPWRTLGEWVGLRRFALKCKKSPKEDTRESVPGPVALMAKVMEEDDGPRSGGRGVSRILSTYMAS
jgi:hypothetical protein